MEKVEISCYDKAIDAIACAVVAPDPDAPSLHQYRLRPSEEALILQQKLQNPPAPWGLKINLSKSFIGPTRCTNIAYKLICNKTVSFLDISMCDLQQDAAVIFFNCLQKNTTLRHLNVNGNNIGDVGAIAAATAIRRLETLHMSSNNISDEACTAIAEAVKGSDTIKTLNLRNNRITSYGVYKIMNVLENTWDLLDDDTKTLLMTDRRFKPPVPGKSSGVDDESKTTQSIKETPETTKAISARGNEGSPKTNQNTTGSADGSEKVRTPETEQKKETFNTTLHTLWVDVNVDIPPAMMNTLAIILAKRFPQLPKSATKKKKKRKATSKK